jgi:hypothetical protein
MNIYLDIDGVLLINEKQIAPHGDEFLQYVVKKYPQSTFWLSTHCWKGENRCVDLLSPLLQPETVELIKTIKPTEWNEMKTDALDFATDFRWLDDDLWPEELKALEDNNATGKFIMVDLAKDANFLKNLIGVL